VTLEHALRWHLPPVFGILPGLRPGGPGRDRGHAARGATRGCQSGGETRPRAHGPRDRRGDVSV